VMVRFGYMSWLDEQIARREELKIRAALLDEHAPKVYADLWECIVKIIEEAKDKLPDARFFPNGSPKERHVLVSFIREGTPDRSMTLKLFPDGRKISAFFNLSEMIFEVGICKDGVVCLKREGNPVSGLDAAHMILGPFLFPELSIEQ